MEHKISRRDLLKGAAAFAVVTAIGGKDSPQPKGKIEGLPEDVLSPEALDQAHISINQSKETKLFLRQDVFDIPVFKDAKEGKIKEVVVTLLDSDTLTTNVVNKLTEGDAKLAWKFSGNDPKMWTEEVWQEMKTYVEDSANYFRDYEKIWQDSLDELLSGGTEKTVRKTIDYYQRQLNIDHQYDNTTDPTIRKALEEAIKRDESNKKKAEDELAQIRSGEKEKELRKFIKDNNQAAETYKQDIEILKGPRSKAIDYYSEKSFLGGDTFGDFLRTDDNPKTIVSLNSMGRSDMIGKVYIYIAVGGDDKPEPSESYPRPDWFSVDPSADKDKKDYAVSSINRPILPGFVLRHEASHYNTQGGRHNEYEADHGALDTIINAWNQYQQTGDSSKYAFVFVNDKGITITKKQQPETKST